MLSIYIAASIHDYDHPGVNNNFLVATGDRRALLYNDKSVLENHHCASAFQVLMKPENDFFSLLDRGAFACVRAGIVEMVLATDLAQHFDLLTRFKKRMASDCGFYPWSQPDDQVILMQILMKCADVSNPTKEWAMYKEWIDRITTEFFNQGDLERGLGLPISPFMNREASTSAQQGFIEFIVNPLFEALEQWIPLKEMRINLNKSRRRFCNFEDEVDAGVDEGHGDDGERRIVQSMPAMSHSRPPLLAASRRRSIVAGIRSIGNVFGGRSSSSVALDKLDTSNT